MKALFAVAGAFICSAALGPDAFAKAPPGKVEPGRRSLEIKDVDAAARFKGSPAVSPDGQWVAYTACDPARIAVVQDQKREGARIAATAGATQFSQGCDVQVMPVAGGVTQSPTEGAGNNWGPVWSPDGRKLLFYSDRDGAPRLWLWNRGETKARRVSEQATQTLWDHELPAWTPDGRYIVAQIQSGDAAAPASAPRGAAGQGGPPPGAEMSAQPQIVQLLNGSRYMSTPTERAPGVTVNVLRPPAASSPPKKDAAAAGADDILPMPAGGSFGQRALGVIEVATGQVRVLVPQFQTFRWRLSVDGQRLAAFEILGMRAKDYNAVANLVTYDIASGERRVLASRVVQGNPYDFNWSPDGRWIAYLDCNAGIPDIKCHGDAWVVRADGSSAPQRLSGAPANNFNHRDSQPRWAGSTVYFSSPGGLWRANAETATLTSVARSEGLVFHTLVSTGDELQLGSPDNGRSAYLMIEQPETRRHGVATVDLTSGTLTRLHEEQAVFGGFGFWGAFAVSGGKSVLVVRSSAHQRRDLWVIGGKAGQKPRQLTRLAPHLDELLLGQSRIVSFKGSDGKPLHAALLLPAGYQPGQRYPLMVSVYASLNQSEFVNDFGIGGGANFNYQMLASRGWAVLRPDMPVNPGTPMKDIVATVLPAIDAVVALGIADPERLAVNGQSNGGFSTLSLITQTKRFKAAIAESPYADTAHLYMAAAGKQFLLNPTGGAMGVTLWQDPQRYVDNSPLYRLDRITTPLLLYAGTEDRPFAVQADVVYAGLVELGKDVTYLRYENETHSIITVANKIDNWNRVWEFLTRHVPAGALPGALP